jgi:hypothetical protein
MSLPPDYLLVILGLAALALHALTWRNRLIRDPVTGRTKAWWLTAEAKAVIEQLGLKEGHMLNCPAGQARCHAEACWWCGSTRPPASRMPPAIVSIWSAARASIGSCNAAVSWDGRSSLAPAQ